MRDGTVRSSKLFGSTVDQLYAKLEASTRPPPEPTPRKKWPTFADCLRDAEDKIHAQAEAKLALVRILCGNQNFTARSLIFAHRTHWLIYAQVRTAEQDLEREQAEFSSSSPGAGPSMYLRQIPTGTEVIDVEAEGLEVVEVD